MRNNSSKLRPNSLPFAPCCCYQNPSFAYSTYHIRYRGRRFGYFNRRKTIIVEIEGMNTSVETVERHFLIDLFMRDKEKLENYRKLVQVTPCATRKTRIERSSRIEQDNEYVIQQLNITINFFFAKSTVQF